MNMTNICNYDLCTGCSACANICPKHCIKMVHDNEGFMRPEIDQNVCVKCEKCRSICPVCNHPVDDKRKPDVYAVQNIDDQEREKSSSGAVFPLLAEYVLDQNGVVFGAGYNNRLEVVHKACVSMDELEALKGSKYVQSDIGDCYRKAKEYLDARRTVLFTGTPCQIAGLHSFLQKEYSNLFTQDLICHGVPSPFIWRKYLDYREKTEGSDALFASFRNKDKGWRVFSLFIEFKNKSIYKETLFNDMYLLMFLKNICLRKSCEHCAFKDIHRQSDITLADLWGLKTILPEWDDDKGTSLVMIHTKKGKELLNNISNKIKLQSIEYDIAVKSNPSMTESVTASPLRDRLLKDSEKMPFDKLYEKYCGSSLLSRLRQKQAKMISLLRKHS